MEIHKLHEMLTEAGIEHEWRDRTPNGVVGRLKEVNWGWQVCVFIIPMVSA